MSNALTIFDQPKLQVPDHIRNIFGDESNIAERQTVPSLSYEGKVWTINVNGEKTRLMKRDENGDEMPMPVMRVVVLNYNKRRGRTYYAGAYDPAKPGTPLCFSEDGITPHATVQQPQSNKCDGCPMSIKGSKVTEQGKAVTACSQNRMIAVVPATNMQFTPLRMKLAITSDWDKNEENAAQGWFAFQNYIDWLRTRNIPHTARIVTKMRFDPSVAYPKVLFGPDRWLTDEEALTVKPVWNSSSVTNLLGGTWSPNGVDGTRMDQAKFLQDDTPKAAPAPKPVPKPAPAPAAEWDDEDDAPPPPPKKAAPKLAAVPIDMDDDEDDAPPPPKKVAKVVPKKVEPAVEAKPVAATKSAPDELSALLDDWEA